MSMGHKRGRALVFVVLSLRLRLRLVTSQGPPYPSRSPGAPAGPAGPGGPGPILYSSYTLTSPFNTQRVINTVKLKLLSVF